MALAPARAGLNSTPSWSKASGEAMDALKVAASSEESCGTSISARSGCPSEERTVMAPSVTAWASTATPASASVAAKGRRPFLHGSVTGPAD